MAHAAAPAAMGATIFWGREKVKPDRYPKKWWGPVVLDAAQALPIRLGIL